MINPPSRSRWQAETAVNTCQSLQDHSTIHLTITKSNRGELLTRNSANLSCFLPSPTWHLPSSTAKKERDGIIDSKAKSAIPGPADYKENDVKTRKAPRFSIGRSQRSAIVTGTTPGPGAYNLPPKFADVPKYLLPNRTTSSNVWARVPLLWRA